MRYILNDSGYIQAVSFNNLLECQNKTCTEYTGTIPTGYENLAIWSETANINAYKIVNGNLTYDSEEDARLQSLWASQEASSSGSSEMTILTNIDLADINKPGIYLADKETTTDNMREGTTIALSYIDYLIVVRKYTDETMFQYSYDNTMTYVYWRMLHLDGDGNTYAVTEWNVTQLNETDPTVPTHVKNITEEDISKWNNGTGVSGDTLPIGSEIDYDGEEVPDGWEKVETNYLLAISTGSTVLSGNTDIPLAKYYSSGNKLTIENNKIKIGTGVSKIRISAAIFMDITQQGSGYMWGRIALNGSNAGGSIQSLTTGTGFNSSVIPTKILNVKENDLIHLNAEVTGAIGKVRDNINTTWVCVEVVE